MQQNPQAMKTPHMQMPKKLIAEKIEARKNDRE